MNRLIGYLLLSLSCSAALLAEPAKRNSESTDLRFAPPLMGYVFDRSLGQIRTVVGIPGAARVTDPVKLDFKLEHALIGAGGAIALAGNSGAAALTLVGSLDSQPTAIAVENSMADFDSGAFNGPGTAAILYSSACKCIQVIGGLPDSPRVSRNIDSASFPGTVLALAVSDDQSIAAVAVASSEDGSSPSRILLFDLNGDSTPPPILTSASSLAFTPGGKDLLLTDAPTGSVSLALNAGGVVDVASASVSSSGNAISNPGAIAFTSDGLLLIADAAGLVHIIDLQTNERKSVGCSCRPDSMDRMKDKSLYRLTGIEAGSVWILDTSGESPRTLFVPIDAPAEVAQ
jgi:hypothetical protein